MEGFSCYFVAPDGPFEALDWLKGKLVVSHESEWDCGFRMYGLPSGIERRYPNRELLIAGELADFQRIVNTICEMQVKFNVEVPWVVQRYESPAEAGRLRGFAATCYRGVPTYYLISWSDENGLPRSSS